MALSRRLPTPLSGRIAGAAGAAFSRQGREFDVAVGGIPFMLATTQDLPQTIETIKVRKEQFDTEDPGEQSLTGYWRRSQSSFHEGAGNLYQESSVQNVAGNGFYSSAGVDVFTPGRLTLLKKMVASTGAATTHTNVRTYSDGSTVKFSAVGDGALHTSTAAAGSFASLHAPASKTIVDGLIANTQFYDVATDGTLYDGAVSSPGSATTWPLTSTASVAPTTIAWGKHRLWVIGGQNIWQPNLAASGGTNQAAIFVHPNKGWKYTAIAEGPSAMYFAGHDGFASSIQAVTLDSGGGVPTLTGASISAILPDGELVQRIAVLAGQFIGIGTNRGFRIGVINADSTITYGPLLLEPVGIQSCKAICTQGRFFVVAFDVTGGSSMAYRFDTGTQIAEGVFPYAADIDTGVAGSITSLVANNNQLLCTASDGKVWYQSLTQYVSTGFIQTGRIRFRTTEAKQFRFLNLGIEPLQGTITASLIRENGVEFGLGSVTEQGAAFKDSFSYQGGSMEYASIKLTLAPTGGLTAAPVITSTLLRALPTVRPQRLITLPLLCMDREKAISGQSYGGDGFSADRFAALRFYEDAGEVLIYQDFAGGTGNYEVVIESLKYVQTSPARAKNPGGIILLELRTVGV